MTFTSTARSSRCRSASASVPTSGSRPSEERTRIPSCSSPRPSSRDDAIMPSDTCPYVFRALMGNGPGSTAPGRLTTTLSPTTKLCAPQTMPRTSAPPSAAVAPSGATRTEHQLMVLPLVWGSGLASSTCPTTTGPEIENACTSSSSRPTFTREAWTSSGVTPRGARRARRAS
ncbi:hypothetical protein BC477_11485 [Clavibacter michiganensis subsp. michiganensis]|uniref:Uncharacterized protein n=1 Tax=Clavibacter michiganensis subsp. michiganensis TaxID=33013 RepID=A0A251XGX8_CLAMM|nr:hypothetical protein BC477_11485 [Clavibacter michiganensis subsp. michiganensis]OUE02417.1 hypothetical protein CMMCAS07_10395 [Clavibacter michiganensis subsp. michiganensis]